LHWETFLPSSNSNVPCGLLALTASYYIRLSVFSWLSLANAHTSVFLHQKRRNMMQVQNIRTYLRSLSRSLLYPHSTHNFTNLHTVQLFLYSEILCNLFHTICSACAAFWTSEWHRRPSCPLVESLTCRARIITSPTATPAPAMTHRCLSSASSSTQQAASTEVKIHVGLLGFWKKGYEGHFHRYGWRPYDLSPRCCEPHSERWLGICGKYTPSLVYD
jgi:hypothetical protein